MYAVKIIFRGFYLLFLGNRRRLLCWRYLRCRRRGLGLFRGRRGRRRGGGKGTEGPEEGFVFQHRGELPIKGAVEGFELAPRRRLHGNAPPRRPCVLVRRRHHRRKGGRVLDERQAQVDEDAPQHRRRLRYVSSLVSYMKSEKFFHGKDKAVLFYFI